MLTITEKAQKRIKSILDEEGSNLFIRAFVQGGGCSGFQYGFTIDETKNEDDFEIPVGNFLVLIDALSMQYLQGSKIDYKEDLMSSQFVIENPNVSSQCGCGSSFSV